MDSLESISEVTPGGLIEGGIRIVAIRIGALGLYCALGLLSGRSLAS